MRPMVTPTSFSVMSAATSFTAVMPGVAWITAAISGVTLFMPSVVVAVVVMIVVVFARVISLVALIPVFSLALITVLPSSIFTNILSPVTLIYTLSPVTLIHTLSPITLIHTLSPITTPLLVTLITHRIPITAISRLRILIPRPSIPVDARVQRTEWTVPPSKSHLSTLLLSSNASSKATRNPTRHRLVSHKVNKDLSAVNVLAMSAVECGNKVLLVLVLDESITKEVPRH